MADETDHDELISRFVETTGVAPAEAQQYLTANRWDIEGAVTEFFTAQEEGGHGGAEAGPESQVSDNYTGPRTLDGRPAPQSIPAVSSSRSAPPKKRGVGGIATLGSLNQGGSSHAGHSHDDSDDSDDEDFASEGEPRDLFAGGEKSGLAVQDPNNRTDPRKVVNDILKKARANAQRSGGEASSSAPPSRFRGGGQTLGGDDTPSQAIPSSHPVAPEPGPIQTRVLHLWDDGFSIEDGELRRFDDPQNAHDLQMIRSGRAPLHLMGVRPDQPVDVQLNKHDEKYKAPPKVYKPFSGSGNRLGSPTPGGSNTTVPAPPSSAPGTSASISEVEIDSSQPTIMLRIQLASGTRLPARFNTTHTIGDVYSFVDRASADTAGRSWVLATTFPNKDHTDRSLVLGEMAEFKRGGTAMQKMV